MRTSYSVLRTFEHVVALETIDQYRNAPARDEQTDDQISDRAEAVVQVRDGTPESALPTGAPCDEPERLHSPDEQRDDHRRERDRQVVVEFSNRLRERPAVGADHQHVV